MDQGILVKDGHKLVDAMNKSGMAPRAAVWIHNTDTDDWRLWIVPAKAMTDKRVFYRKISEIISENKDSFPDFDAADVEMASDTHPAILGLNKMFRVIGKSAIVIKNNMLNGYYVPDGILLQMNI